MDHSGSQTIRVIMDWKSLPAFLAVARNGSLRAAAEHMGGTHATLRRQIEALEAQLGTQLFRRGTDGLSLTAAGQRLLPQALAAEAEAALLKGFNAVQGLDREASGRIRLSADPMTAHYLLAPVLADFAALYPEIEAAIGALCSEGQLRSRTFSPLAPAPSNAVFNLSSVATTADLHRRPSPT